MTEQLDQDQEREAALDERLRAKAAGDLGWTELLDRIASRCVGVVAAEQVRSTRLAPSRDEATVRAQRAAETLALAERGELLPVYELEDLREVIERVRRGAVATGPELRDLARLLKAAGELRRFVARHAEMAPALAVALDSEPALDALAAQLDHAIEPDGAVSDGASPALRQARRRAAEARRDLTRRLGELLHRYGEVLRDSYYAERDGRYVLPVRSDAHFRVPGIVLGSSSSGGTLYVEPHEVTALANTLTLHLAEVHREEQRVLADLSRAAREHADAIALAQEAGVLADVLAAIARWAGEVRAHPMAPTEEPELVLFNMRHPLLLGGTLEVVPNDLELGAGTALVISGPNAGGKTVALKSLGLAAWMVRAGIPIPAAAESRVGWFDRVLTDVGDEQSLAMSLSTFSAHVANLQRIIERAGSNTLVLLDELAGGTDPEEGAALATAVLESLVEADAAVATTTHYERLKEAAAEHDHFRNASVGFDFEAMVPTFRLTLDMPGPSSALAVAARFGVPPAVVERARALMPEQALAREDLIGQLSREREALYQARISAERDAREQARLKEQIEAERATARQKERARLAREGEALMASVRQARARLHEVEKRLRRSDLRSEDLAELQKLVDGAARPVVVGSELARAARGGGAERELLQSADLRPGMQVYLTKLDRQAEVVEVTPKGAVRVLAGPLKMLVPLSELRRGDAKPSASRRSAAKPRPRVKEPTGVDGFVPVRAEDITLDLRGQRVEAALDAVDAFLDRLLNRGERVGYVLHGHGTGALKAAVRDHLRASGYVARSHPAEPDDGGDAFTVAWIKG
jgi:DNA mismatch repair protein MutS2